MGRPSISTMPGSASYTRGLRLTKVGLPDLVAVGDSTPILLRNTAGRQNHWLGVRLIGRKSNIDAVGANEPMVEGTGLEAACHTGTNANAFASIVLQLYHQPFTSEEIILRKRLLGDTYDNEKNTWKLIPYLW